MIARGRRGILARVIINVTKTIFSSKFSSQVKFNVVDRKGQIHALLGNVGDSVMKVCHQLQHSNPEIALEGACEASLACSTCHVIVEPAWYDKLADRQPPCEKEEDMLDLAACLYSSSQPLGLIR